MKLPTLDNVDPSDPRQVSQGPKGYWQAWTDNLYSLGKVIGLVENSNADEEALAAAYERKIAQVKELTGVVLDNPMSQLTPIEQQSIAPASVPAGGMVIPPPKQQIRAERIAMFENRVSELAKQHPQVMAVLGTGIQETAYGLQRDAQNEADLASMAPELGAIGRFTSSLAGGFKGQLTDPAQLPLLFIGGEYSAARSVVSNIGRGMLTDAVINSGSEAVLQMATAESKQKAGLAVDFKTSLEQVGIAGALGGLFGGVTQSASALVHSLKLHPDVQPPIERILKGMPDKGDVEAVSGALGVPIKPEHSELMSRAWDDHELDGYGLSENASPDEIAVYEAAIRHAEDPDNFPPPEAVARMLADRRAEKLFPQDIIQSARQAEPNAVEHVLSDGRFPDLRMHEDLGPHDPVDLAPARPVEPMTPDAMAQAVEAAGELRDPKRVGPYGPIHNAGDFTDWASAVDALRRDGSGEIPGGISHPDIGPIDVVWGKYDAASGKGAGLAKIVEKHPGVVADLPRIVAGMDVKSRSENRVVLEAPDHKAVVRLEYDGEAKTWLMTAYEKGRRAPETTHRLEASGDGPSSSPAPTGGNIQGSGADFNLSDLQAHPDHPREGKLDVSAMIPVVDQNGNTLMVSVREALAMAEEPALLADVLEACKL